MQGHAAGAQTPEDLATRFEDAFIVRDPDGLAELFDEHAVLLPPDSHVDLRGGEEIARFAAAHWEGDRSYVAEVRRVVQAGDTAAVVVDWSLSRRGFFDAMDERGRGVDVVRRGTDGAWRYVISLVRVCERSKGELS